MAKLNQQAAELARKTGIKASVGSDAHWPHVLGKNVMAFKSLNDIKGQLMAGKYSFSTTLRNPIEIKVSKLCTAYVQGGILLMARRLWKLVWSK